MSSANQRRPSLAQRLILSAGPPAYAGAVKLLRLSSKVHIDGENRLQSVLATDRPAIVGIWHGSVAMVWILRLHVQVPALAMMVSRSRDGELATAMTRGFGATIVRASSSRGGAAGLLEMRRLLGSAARGEPPVLGLHILDGPRGPRHKTKPGIVTLARHTHALIVPLVLGLSRRIVFRRAWDRQRIALPFGRFVYRFGAPIDVCESEDSAGNGSLVAKRSSEDGAWAERIDQAMETLAEGDPLCARDYHLD